MSLEEAVKYISDKVSKGELSEHYRNMALSLERRGQVILYGPPGTGKTFTAKKFIDYCMMKDKPKSKPRLWLYGTLSHTEEPFSWYVNGSLCRNIAEGDYVLIVHVSNKKNSIIGLAKVEYSKGEKYKSEKKSELYRNHLQQIYYFKPSLDISDIVQYFKGAEEEIVELCAVINENWRGNQSLASFNLKEAVINCLANNGEREKIIKALKSTETETAHFKMCTFHPSFSYEDFIEGYKPIQTNEGLIAFHMENGVFKEYCLEAAKNPDIDYYFIIDEINRGNTAKIFGEIITLLEMDKRGTTLTLPQSKSQFSIPENLYIIGTMNSADRSISSLDVALRRRFSLIEIPSDPQALSNTIVYEKDGDDIELELSEMLEGINTRLQNEMGIGANKWIGHGYFYKDGEEIDEPQDLRDILRFEVLPILLEYCSYDTERYTDVFGYLERLCTDLAEE